MAKNLLLFVFLWNLAVHAAVASPPEATLLLGIRGLEEPRKSRTYNRMALEFERKWSSDFSTHVVRDASYLDLFKVLKNPSQQVLFWVGHAGSFDSPAGLSSGRITDSYGDDVKNLFKLLPANLYWLGLVGCKAEPILKGFDEQGYYDHLAPRFVTSSYAATFPFGINVLHRRIRNHHGLVIDSSKNLVDAFRGLRATMNAANWPALHVAPSPDQECHLGPYLHIEAVRRSEGSPLAAISVESGEYPLTIFDRGDTSNRYPLLLPWDELEGLEDVSLVVHGRQGFDPTTEDEELGQLEFWSPTLGLKWQRVEVGGRPLGRTQHVYRLDALSLERLREARQEPTLYWTRLCYN